MEISEPKYRGMETACYIYLSYTHDFDVDVAVAVAVAVTDEGIKSNNWKMFYDGVKKVVDDSTIQLFRCGEEG